MQKKTSHFFPDGTEISKRKGERLRHKVRKKPFPRALKNLKTVSVSCEAL